MSSTKQGQNQSAKVIRQGSFLVIASLAVNVMNLAYRIPITRLWGDQGMGIYSDAYQIYTYFLVLASYGIPATMSKMISERLARKEYRNAQTVFKCAAKVVTVVGLVSMLIMMAFNKVIATAVYNNPLASRPIFFLGPTVLIVALTSVISGFFQGRTNMQPTSISVVVEGAIHAIVSVLLAYTLMGYGSDWSVTGGIFGTTIGAIGSMAVLGFSYWLYKRSRQAKSEAPLPDEEVEKEKDILKEMLKLMIPITLSSTLFTIKSIIDATLFGKLMLSMGTSAGMAVAMRGIYSGKFVTLLNIPISIGESFGSAAVPAISEARARGDQKALEEECSSITRTALIIAVPSAIGLATMGKPVLRMLFPSTFLGGELFWIGAPAVIFYSVNYVAVGVLQGLGKPHYSLVISAIGVLITSLMSVINIRVMHIGIFSLPLNTSIFSFFIMIGNLYYAQKFGRIRIHVLKLARGPFICAALMGLLCYLSYVMFFAITGRNIIAALGGVLVGIFTYFGLMVNLGLLTSKDEEVLPGGRYLEKFRL